MQIEPLVSEEAYYGREDQAETFLRSIGSEGTGTAICSQGGVIPNLLRKVAAIDGYALPDPVQAKKGSVWNLTFSGRKLISAEYFPPLV